MVSRALSPPSAIPPNSTFAKASVAVGRSFTLLGGWGSVFAKMGTSAPPDWVFGETAGQFQFPQTCSARILPHQEVLRADIPPFARRHFRRGENATFGKEARQSPAGINACRVFPMNVPSPSLPSRRVSLNSNPFLNRPKTHCPVFFHDLHRRRVG